MENKRIYIYGIISNIDDSEEFFELIKLNNVTTVSFRDISAIVSETDSRPLKSLSKESLAQMLVHHQKTIEGLMVKGGPVVLPMRLGTIANSRQEVRRILETGYGLIVDTLKKYEKLVEVDLVATWNAFSDILNEISRHPDIETLKNGMLSQSDMIKVGMMVQEKLKEKNKAVELKIMDALSQLSQDIKIHEVMNDEMVTNSAFLLKEDKQDQFEEVIRQIDKDFKGVLNFKLVGPLPCYSFSTIEVKELSPDEVILAKTELGLEEKSSASEIKKAYLGKAKLFHPDALPVNGNDEQFNRINKAYQILREYSAAVKQSSKADYISLVKEEINENLILVKVKE
jgi:hypothetical protein